MKQYLAFLAILVVLLSEARAQAQVKSAVTIDTIEVKDLGGGVRRIMAKGKLTLGDKDKFGGLMVTYKDPKGAPSGPFVIAPPPAPGMTSNWEAWRDTVMLGEWTVFAIMAYQDGDGAGQQATAEKKKNVE